MKMLRIRLAFVGLAAFGMCAPAFAQEMNEMNEPAHEHQVVNLEDLPPAAQKTLQKEAKGNKIGEIFKETAKGKTVYEAEFTEHGHKVELRVDEKGKVIERERIKK